MFSRRNKQTLYYRVRDMLWPYMGWKRCLRYYQYRLARHPRPAQEIAGALACGAMVTFIPIIGSHAALTVMMCWIARLPIVPGLVGTLVGNFWTVPPAWWLAHKVGMWGADLLGFERSHAEPFTMSITSIRQMRVEDFFELMIPWTIAGIVLSILSWPIFYVLFLFLIEEAKRGLVVFRKARRALKAQIKEQLKDLTE